LSVGIVFAGKSAFGAAEYVNVFFIISAVKEPGDEISLLRQRFFTYGAAPLNIFFFIRMTMGASENMAEPVFFSGIQDCFKLFAQN